MNSLVNIVLPNKLRMSPKYSAAVLIVVALWSALSMAIAGSLRMHITPSSYASDELNAVASMKSNTDLTARNITDEERVRPPPGIAEIVPVKSLESFQRLFGDKFTKDVGFSTWFEAANRMKTQKLSKEALEWIFEMAKTHFGEGLAGVLVAGLTKDAAAKALAEALLDKMVTVWKNDDTFDPVKVFKILELDQADGNLFEHPLFPKWIQFVKLKFPKDLKNADIARFETLKVFFPGSDHVAVLVAGMKVESQKGLALRLLYIQFREWEEKPISYDDMFRLLKLSEGNLLENILFFRLKNFIFNKNSGKMARKILFNTMEKGLGDRVVSVLVAGTKNEHTKWFFDDLLDNQLEAWQQNKKSEDEVFELLGLKQTEGNLLSSPFFSKWKHYIYDTRSSWNDFIEKIYMGLKHKLGVRLESVLFEGAKTERTRALANKLLSMDKVLKEAMTHYEQLKQTHDNLFVNRIFFKWFESVQKIFPNMDSSAILEHLFSHDELAGIILSGWANSETNPTVVELMNSLSDKKAVFQCILERLGLVR